MVVYASEKLALHVCKDAESAHARAMQCAGRAYCQPPCTEEVRGCQTRDRQRRATPSPLSLLNRTPLFPLLTVVDPKNTFVYDHVEAELRCSVPRQTAQDLLLTGLGWVNVFGRPRTKARFRVHKPSVSAGFRQCPAACAPSATYSCAFLNFSPPAEFGRAGAAGAAQRGQPARCREIMTPV